jgi:osmotically-inducible protein OsmY
MAEDKSEAAWAALRALAARPGAAAIRPLFDADPNRFARFSRQAGDVLLDFSKTAQSDEVLAALKANWTVPNDKVMVKVEDGWITLEGELPWNFQKEAAKKTVNYLLGVKGVTNNITIKSNTNEALEKADVEAAIGRSWTVDDRDIVVSVSGTTVTLSGTVNSWYQRDEAARIAWNTPGIWHVKNELAVDYEYAFT